MNASALTQLKQALLKYKVEVKKEASQREAIPYGEANLQIETFETILQLTHQRLMQIFLSGVNPKLGNFAKKYPQPILSGTRTAIEQYINALNKALDNQLALEHESLKVKEQLEKAEKAEPLGVLAQRLETIKAAHKEFEKEKARRVQAFKPALTKSMELHQKLLANLFPNLGPEQITMLQEQLLTLTSDYERRALLMKKMGAKDFSKLPKGVSANQVDQFVSQTTAIHTLRQEAIKRVFMTSVQQDAATTALLLLPKEIISNPQVEEGVLRQARKEILDIITNEISLASLLPEEHLGTRLAALTAKYAEYGINIPDPTGLASQIVDSISIPSQSIAIKPLGQFLAGYKPHQKAKNELKESVKSLQQQGKIPGLGLSPSDEMVDRLMEMALEQSLLATTTIPETIKKEDIQKYIEARAREAVAWSLVENQALISAEQAQILVDQISLRLQTAQPEITFPEVVKGETHLIVDDLTKKHPELAPVFKQTQIDGTKFVDALANNINQTINLSQARTLPSEQQEAAFTLSIQTALKDTLIPIAQRLSTQLIGINKTPALISYLKDEAAETQQLLINASKPRQRVMEAIAGQLAAKDKSIKPLRRHYSGKLGLVMGLLAVVTTLFKDIAPSATESYRRQVNQTEDAVKELEGEKKEHGRFLETGLAFPVIALQLYLNRKKIIRRIRAYRRLWRWRKLAAQKKSLPQAPSSFSLSILRSSRLGKLKVSLGNILSANLQSYFPRLFPGGSFLFSPSGLRNLATSLLQPNSFFGRLFSFFSGINQGLRSFFRLGGLGRLVGLASKALGPVGWALSLIPNVLSALGAFFRGQFGEALRRIIPKEIRIAVYAIVGVIIVFFLLFVLSETSIQSAFVAPPIESKKLSAKGPVAKKNKPLINQSLELRKQLPTTDGSFSITYSKESNKLLVVLSEPYSKSLQKFNKWLINNNFDTIPKENFLLTPRQH